MQDLKGRFRISPIHYYPCFPNYVVSHQTIGPGDVVEWPEGKFHAQKPYRYQDVDSLGAQHFITFQFFAPISMVNFKMHPSWEEANVVVRIWGSWMDYNNGIIFEKWHLMYETSYSRNHTENYKECSVLINTIRIEFNKNFMTYTPAVGTILSPPLIEGTTTRFHLFCPLNNTVLYNRRQELTHNVIPLRETEVKLNGQNFTEILPPEVLYNIFDSLDLRSLSRCAQVNERWNLIANNLHFYRDIDLKMYWDKINTNTLEKLRKKLQKVRKLDMTWCNEYQLGSAEFAPHEFIDSIERILEEAKETLTHLCLNHASWISKTILHRIFDCSNLEELRLRNIHFRDFNYWSMSSNTVMKLKTLDVSMSGIEKKHLTDILKNSPNLENLIMDDCRRLKNPEPIITTVTNYNKKLKTWSSSSTFSGQDSSQIYGEFGKLIYLEYLDLSLCEPEPYRTNCLENIAMNCKKLKRLELAFWKQLTDQQLLPIITRCKELSHLNLTKTTKISPMALSIACNNLPNLRHLCIYSSIEISKEMIEDLTQKYPKVKMYNLK